VTGWTDPVTGLWSGPVEEPDYPLRCQHCDRDIRKMPGGDFYSDRAGWTYCQKDLAHQPLPEVPC
jgi:hypothetical protein